MADERLTILRKRNEFKRSPNMLIIGEELLSRDECDHIIGWADQLPYTECRFGFDPNDANKVEPVDLSAMDRTWKYTHSDGKDFVVLHPDDIMFKRCMEYVDPFLPKNEDYQGVNYAQIIRYRKDTKFDFHMDTADGNDTATAIWFLNEEYDGGRLNVEGHILNPRRGSMVTFNNSTERWHGVEPIYDGERWVFAIWFGRYDELEQGTDDESEQTEMQSVSDDARPDES